MQLLVIPILGLAPGIFWLWLIYRRDKYRPEPKGLVIRTFLLGMASVLPVLIIEVALALPYIFSHVKDFTNFTVESLSQLSIGEMAYFSFIIAGFTEELFKFLVVRTTIYKSPYFDEPIDGLVYASAAALGFASLENVGYLFSYGWETILVRAPISTLAHVVFSAMWGYPLALRKLKRHNSTLLLWLGLLGAMLGHGLFDFLAMAQGDSNPMNIPLLAGLIVLFAGMVVFFVFLLIRGQKTSPFKDKNAELLTLCPNCQTRVPYYAGFCPNCGNKLPEDKKASPEFCGKCGAGLENGVNFCTSCGSRVIKKAGLG
ncbi:MAG: PrsW family glutamic-type intramembrane protease [Dehalococcoidales bacterium]|nr:PrsW family glutamic-type intramembrane protease [Dehalococcoidales bacterium]